MSTIRVNLPGRAYNVHIEAGALAKLGVLVKNISPHQRCALLADENVFKLYGDQAQQALERSGYSVLVGVQPCGELYKTLDTVRNFYQLMLNARLERKSPVISLGGGVNGDTAGFVAATYLRGVPFIQCPTSLLAMVDESVGGKVGVDMPQGKNLIGAFYQPQGVVIDPQVLKTLPLRELRCGLAECIKHALIRDASLFEWIENNLDRILACEMQALEELVSRNVLIKARVVEADEKEEGERAHLNLGHTFAHAIETTSGYDLIGHGEAVALGMLAAASVAAQLQKVPNGSSELLLRLKKLLEAAGLPTRAKLASAEQLIDSMRSDKKVRADKIRIVTSPELGKAEILTDVPQEVIRQAWEVIRAV